WRKLPREQIEIVGGWDHDVLRAGKAGQQHQIRMHDKPEDVLVNGRVDAVVIAAETSMHADLVVMAARAHKAIVLQKPMALTLADADRIVRAVHDHHVPFTLAWQMRVDPQNIEMRNLVREGALGRVFMIRRRHGLSTHTWRGFRDTWHVNPALNRGM